MKINTLELTNVRGFTYAKLDFQAGFNLIVGLNGVGKTTVLESIRIVLSHLLAEATVSKNKKDNFDIYDIQIEKESLQLNANLSFFSDQYSFVLSKQKDGTKIIDTDDIRNQTFEVNNDPVFKPTIPKEYKLHPNQSIGIYFSSHRSLMNEEKASKSQTYGGQTVAFADSLNIKREFSIRLFADWFLAQEKLAVEIPNLLVKINKIKKAIYTFLPGFSDLLVTKDLRGERNTFSIVKNKKKLSLQQLSDGERSIITLVLDISRRLTIANTTLENPMHGEAVILIDELDLHLHPKWQRTIVNDLVRTFPNCQFIATTHSPQIISSVLPENIQIIKNFEIDQAIKSYGLDINYILKHLMQDDDRLDESTDAIEAVQSLIDEVEFDKARSLIAAYRKENLNLSEWEMLEARMSYLEMFEDEEDN